MRPPRRPRFAALHRRSSWNVVAKDYATIATSPTSLDMCVSSSSTWSPGTTLRRTSRPPNTGTRPYHQRTLDEFREHFPDFQLEDELFAQAGRDVMIGIPYAKRRPNSG